MLNESYSEQLKISISDLSQPWTGVALYKIICNELRSADKPLDSDLIDIACVRLMLLNEMNITPRNLHEFEENLMHGILCNELGIPSNNKYEQF